jgi:hypothetical protein
LAGDIAAIPIVSLSAVGVTNPIVSSILDLAASMAEVVTEKGVQLPMCSLGPMARAVASLAAARQCREGRRRSRRVRCRRDVNSRCPLSCFDETRLPRSGPETCPQGSEAAPEERHLWPAASAGEEAAV